MSEYSGGAPVQFVAGEEASNGAVAVVGRAELTNRADLDARLGTEGSTDVACVSALVDRDGLGGLGRLRGPFALGVQVGSRWHLVRDQLGTMPLYHRRLSDGVVQASTSVAPLADGLGIDDIDRVGAAFAVSGLWGDPTRTLWRDVRRLPAGHRLAIAHETNSPHDDWAPHRRLTQSERRPMADVAADVRRLLLQATERALMGATRSATELSGGFDSSTVAGSAALLTAPVQQLAYTWAGDDVHADLPFAEDVARMHDLDLRRVPVGASPERASDRARRWRDAPGNYLIDEVERAMTDAVGAGATRYLTGHLGDLVFAGDVWLAFAEYVGRGELSKLRTITDRGRRVPEFVRDVAMTHPRLRRRRPPAYTTSLSDDLAAAVHDAGVSEGSFRPGRGQALAQRAGRLRTPQPQRVMEVLHQLGEDHGIAVRHPLVDVDLVEFLLTVPSGYLVGPPNNRCLHADAIDGIAPDSVRTRTDKARFDWSAMDAIEAASPDDLLADSVLASLRVVDEARSLRVLRDVRAAWADGKSSHAGWELTGLIEAETFLRAIGTAG